MAGGRKHQAKRRRGEPSAAASPASSSAEGVGSTEAAGDELALVPTMATVEADAAEMGEAREEAAAPAEAGEEAEAPAEAGEEAEDWAARRRGRQGRDLLARAETGVMRPRTMWSLVVAAYRGLPDFQRDRVRGMGFGPILEIEPFFVDPPLIQVIRDKWDRVSPTFLFPWGHMVPSLEDMARITGLRVDGEAVTGVTYVDYTDLTQRLLGLEPFGEGDRERRMVGRMSLLESLGLAGVWSYYYIPLGRATEVDPTAVPLARRWLPLVSTATYAFQLDVLRRHVRDYPALLVVWDSYAGQGDAGQPWVMSGRGSFGRDIWVHCLNEIEPLRLRLVARTLGLHQRWSDETEPRGIGRKTHGKAKTVDWWTRFSEQFTDWHRGGQVVVSDATDSTAYLQRFQEEYGARDFMRSERDGRDTLIGQLEGQLAEARVTLETLRAAQVAAVQADAGGASSSRGPSVEVSSFQGRLTAAVERAERAERDLLTRTEELKGALAREAGFVTELTEQSRRLTELQSQVTQPEAELPCDVAELRALLALERRDLERQQAWWELERSRWELERERLTQQLVETRTSQGVAERLLKASEDRYRRGRERAREQGRASAYSESILATSSQHERNVQDGAAAQRSTGS
ncbi:hypothetical protein Taro_047462 [Colocasia esculenta]|uniref:Aminotransferase-like plant mobile domain-containing protein n=1 Tax=Colocasia esculenta TaxID=4460 RepID=A0A843X7X7_COLES|nr:hypothetical protein [Colocasia esculenta]